MYLSASCLMSLLPVPRNELRLTKNLRRQSSIRLVKFADPSGKAQLADDYQDALEDDEVLVSRNRLSHKISPSKPLKDKSGLDASAKLTRAKLNKRSGDADLSKDKSGPESPPEFRRSWYVEGHIRSGVISSFLAQRYLRYNLTKLGDEGLSSRGTKLNSVSITADVTFTKLKQPTTFAKMKATPRKLAYADSDKEAPARSLARGFSD
ncbi:hypothetical protein Tco_0368953 [Tanacetum coccineum]